VWALAGGGRDERRVRSMQRCPAAAWRIKRCACACVLPLRHPPAVCTQLAGCWLAQKQRARALPVTLPEEAHIYKACMPMHPHAHRCHIATAHAAEAGSAMAWCCAALRCRGHRVQLTRRCSLQQKRCGSSSGRQRDAQRFTRSSSHKKAHAGTTHLLRRRAAAVHLRLAHRVSWRSNSGRLPMRRRRQRGA
jgi:hypothetical protein